MYFDTCEDILRESIAGDVIPSAAFAIGQGREVLRSGVMGDRTRFPAPEKADRDTLYDLASLSKLVSTTMVALRLVEQGRLLLSDTMSRWFTPAELAGAPEGRADVTVFRLMTHTSGITPHIALWNRTETPEQSAVAHIILSSEPFCRPGEQVYYSCMGYILLQIILERLTGRRLDDLAREYVFAPLGMAHTGYCPESDNVVTTEYSALYKAYIKGHVHDENAHFLGGVSGNAGVFAPLDDMIRFAVMCSTHGCGGNPRLYAGACRGARTRLPAQAAPACAVLGRRPYGGWLLRAYRLYRHLPVGGCGKRSVGRSADQRRPFRTRQNRVLSRAPRFLYCHGGGAGRAAVSFGVTVPQCPFRRSHQSR